ncbi:MAG: ribonuclease P protein component [Longimonas sp.]|uniref:ribonuclease P protein component n=1 Tax=Longimonas sp. TaxID=2039626 RepID=UPI0039751234
MPPPASDRRYTFPRTHRLKRRRLIASLFDRSRSDVQTVACGTVRLLYRWASRREVGHNVPVQVGFAPGRTYATNVQRTQIRRYLRETYRQHQYVLRKALPDDAPPLIMMLLFRGSPDHARTSILRDVPRALRAATHALPDCPAPSSTD